MKVIVRRCVERSRLIKELYENWQIEHTEAMKAHDVGELCAERVEVCNLSERAWTALLNHFFAQEIADTERTGRWFKLAVDTTGEIINRVLTLAFDMEKTGYGIEGFKTLQQHAEKLAAIQTEIPHKWPFVDRQAIALSREEFRRGEYQTVEDLLNAAKGGCP